MKTEEKVRITEKSKMHEKKWTGNKNSNRGRRRSVIGRKVEPSRNGCGRARAQAHLAGQSFVVGGIRG